MMDVEPRFYLGPLTRRAYVRNHGLDGEEVLANPGEDRPGRDGSRVAVGEVTNGRCLRVAYVRDPESGSFFAIAEYELRGDPLSAYRWQQMRKHG